MVSFGKLVKEERERQGLSKHGLARLLNLCDAGGIVDLERDRHGISLQRMERVAKALDCELVVKLVPKEAA